ncbi:phosphopantothenoylcysteine decarboxylase [Phtheirospermum japonicum]|uniref:phosphopantothenoylcysteine decarboxylase n=1 Tax=Phtheirospermum japonicum TaxID=374723 RepID=A0A830C8Y8_9LAMI|nr:phosphopantothenoylcysteine decarboxylase [Phtheirospermum japonicum]
MEGHVPRKRILLVITDTPAAAGVEALCDGLNEFADVCVLCSRESTTFFNRFLLASRYRLIMDEDDQNQAVMIPPLLAWAEALVVAPLSVQKLAEIAGGHAVDFATRLVRSWDHGEKPMYLAPDIPESMWYNGATEKLLQKCQDIKCHVMYPRFDGSMSPVDILVDDIKMGLDDISTGWY